MKITKFRNLSIAALITLFALTLGSFNQVVLAADSSPDKPGDVPVKVSQTVHDQTNEKTAEDKTAFGGDLYKLGWFERPFDQNMGYLPFMDISTVLMNREDPNWVYVQITTVNPIEEGAASKPIFGVEMDTDLDNRGEFMLMANIPQTTDWSTEGVMVLANSDNMVGGIKPVVADTNISETKGYDKEVFNAGKGDDPNLAWARISPSDPNTIELAIKSTFLGGAKGKFIWLAWSLVGMQDLAKFEINDHFTQDEAGSPLKADGGLYPLKAVWGVDGTPRIPSGFVPTGIMPGLAQNFQPQP